jgi:arylformamidase
MTSGSGTEDLPEVRLVDLTHPVEAGMLTHPGLPAPKVTTHLSRADSVSHYAPGTTFEIGAVEMVGNTGTYLDAPLHRYADGADLAELPLQRTAALPGAVADLTGLARREIAMNDLAGVAVAARALVLHTGWDRHWRTPGYGIGAPYLSADAAADLVARGVLLVGIDSVNVDDIEAPSRKRPAHSILLAGGVPVLEHLTGLAALPPQGFWLHAAPVPVRAMGTFPVRAYAVVPLPDQSRGGPASTTFRESSSGSM